MCVSLRDPDWFSGEISLRSGERLQHGQGPASMDRADLPSQESVRGDLA